MKIISKKRLKKTDYGLVVKINQMQAHYSGRKKDCENAKIDNITEKFQE